MQTAAVGMVGIIYLCVSFDTRILREVFRKVVNKLNSLAHAASALRSRLLMSLCENFPSERKAKEIASDTTVTRPCFARPACAVSHLAVSVLLFCLGSLGPVCLQTRNEIWSETRGKTSFIVRVQSCRRRVGFIY